MDKQQAQNIIKETFENPFDKDRFTGFVKNLLNQIDGSHFAYYAGLPVLSKIFLIKLTVLTLHIMVNLYRTPINHLLADMNELVNIVIVKTELIFLLFI